MYISSDNYYDKNMPARSDQIYNSVSVQTQPLSTGTWPTDASNIFTNKEAITVPVSGLDYTAVYSKIPCTDTTTTLTDDGGGAITVSSVDSYAWGAIVHLLNSDVSPQTCAIAINGMAWQVQGEESVIATDASSILLYKVQNYNFPVNHLIQTKAHATAVADLVVSSYKNLRKDLTLKWRGNPAVEIGDEVSVKLYNKLDATANFKVYKNNLSFDGYLQETTEGRYIP